MLDEHGEPMEEELNYDEQSQSLPHDYTEDIMSTATIDALGNKVVQKTISNTPKSTLLDPMDEDADELSRLRAENAALKQREEHRRFGMDKFSLKNALDMIKLPPLWTPAIGPPGRYIKELDTRYFDLLEELTIPDAIKINVLLKQFPAPATVTYRAKSENNPDLRRDYQACKDFLIAQYAQEEAGIQLLDQLKANKAKWLDNGQSISSYLTTYSTIIGQLEAEQQPISLMISIYELRDTFPPLLRSLEHLTYTQCKDDENIIAYIAKVLTTVRARNFVPEKVLYKQLTDQPSTHKITPIFNKHTDKPAPTSNKPQHPGAKRKFSGSDRERRPKPKPTFNATPFPGSQFCKVHGHCRHTTETCRDKSGEATATGSGTEPPAGQHKITKFYSKNGQQNRKQQKQPT